MLACVATVGPLSADPHLPAWPARRRRRVPSAPRRAAGRDQRCLSALPNNPVFHVRWELTFALRHALRQLTMAIAEETLPALLAVGGALRALGPATPGGAANAATAAESTIAPYTGFWTLHTEAPYYRPTRASAAPTDEVAVSPLSDDTDVRPSSWMDSWWEMVLYVRRMLSRAGPAGDAGEAAIRRIAVSPTGAHAATVAVDGTLRLWNARTGARIGPRTAARCAERGYGRTAGLRWMRVVRRQVP